MITTINRRPLSERFIYVMTIADYWPVLLSMTVDSGYNLIGIAIFYRQVSFRAKCSGHLFEGVGVWIIEPCDRNNFAKYPKFGIFALYDIKKYKIDILKDSAPAFYSLRISGSAVSRKPNSRKNRYPLLAHL